MTQEVKDRTDVARWVTPPAASYKEGFYKRSRYKQTVLYSAYCSVQALWQGANAPCNDECWLQKSYVTGSKICMLVPSQRKSRFLSHKKRRWGRVSQYLNLCLKT